MYVFVVSSNKLLCEDVQSFQNQLGCHWSIRRRSWHSGSEELLKCLIGTIDQMGVASSAGQDIACRRRKMVELIARRFALGGRFLGVRHHQHAVVTCEADDRCHVLIITYLVATRKSALSQLFGIGRRPRNTEREPVYQAESTKPLQLAARRFPAI